MERSLILGVISLVSGFISIAISYVAWRLAKKTDTLGRKTDDLARETDKVIRAIANLKYDEKLAVMAIHLADALRIPETDLTDGDKKQLILLIESVEYDLSAVTSLISYGSSLKKTKLISEFIKPIVDKFLSINLEFGAANAVGRIIEMALSYKIDADEFKDFQRRLRRVE